MDNNIGVRIRAIRKKKGISGNRLAIAMGIHRAQVSRWETGKKIPQSESLERICKVLKCSSKQLLGF